MRPSRRSIRLYGPYVVFLVRFLPAIAAPALDGPRSHRRILLYSGGVIRLTGWRRGRSSRSGSEEFDELRELKELDRVEVRSPGRDDLEWIGAREVGPAARERGQTVIVIEEVDPVLAPVATVRDELLLASVKRMEWVGDPEVRRPIHCAGCSR